MHWRDVSNDLRWEQCRLPVDRITLSLLLFFISFVSITNVVECKWFVFKNKSVICLRSLYMFIPCVSVRVRNKSRSLLFSINTFWFNSPRWETEILVLSLNQSVLSSSSKLPVAVWILCSLLCASVAANDHS